MTTDPFTEAARESAEQFLWALPDDHPAKPLHNDGFMQTHARVVAGLVAEWARTHLAAQETDGERAVRELHRPVEVEPSDTICAACSTLRGSGESLRYFPFEEWPCATIQALDSARAARRDEEKR